MVYTGIENDIKRRSVTAIALKESSDHGGYYFMSIYTGKCLHSYQWIEIPIYDDVIAHVRDLAEGDDAKKMTDNYPMFELAPGVLITDDVIEEDKLKR